MPSNSSTPLYSSSPRSPLSTAVTPAMLPGNAYNNPPLLHLTPLPSPSLSAIGATPSDGASKSSLSVPNSTTTGGHHTTSSHSHSSDIPTTEDSHRVTTMPEVRRAIDRLDEEIVSLLAVRLRFIEAAARIKEDKRTVRDEERKRDVIEKAVRKAKGVGFDEGITRAVYEALVEGCIEYEEVRWRDVRGLEDERKK